MNFTAKSRYALKIMLDLADCQQAGKQQRNQIALRQGISVDFMDHIMARLRDGELIRSTRGRNGGFELKKSPEDISLWDIFTAVEDHVYPVRCLVEEDLCQLEESCISHDAWSDVALAIKKELAVKSLAYFIHKWRRKAANTGPLSSLQKYREPVKCSEPSGRRLQNPPPENAAAPVNHKRGGIVKGGYSEAGA